MRTLTVIVAVLLVAGGTAGLPAQSQDRPAWLLYQQGQSLAGQGEFGKALQAFREAILAAGVMPEAEAAIGDIYRAEGEFKLAEKQYERAYNLRNALLIPAEKYGVLLRWAGLYEDQEMYRPMEEKLLMIVRDDRWRSSELLSVQVERNFVEGGLDRVLTLYRFDSQFAVDAYSRLGWFYYRTGRYPQALRDLLYAVILRVSDVADYLKQKDSALAIDGLTSFLSAALRDRDTRAWLESSSLAADLYYLASAAWELGHPQRAEAVWKALASLKETGKFADLSRRQLIRPFREPMLSPAYRLPGKP